MVQAAGFEVLATGRPYLIRRGDGPGAPALAECLGRPLRDVPRRLLARRGALHAWVLGGPR